MNVQRIIRTIWVAVLALAMVEPLIAQEGAVVEPLISQEEASFSVTGRYTAQRRPRITVLDFEDTNASAKDARYGSSVQAMLVTYLKRKSQLVVVERQKLENVLQEWKRNGKLTNLQPEDPTAKQLLEKVDGIIIGNVTLLNVYTEANVAGEDDGSSGDGKKKKVGGPRIEIDAKLLSLADGRIIAVAQRRGPVACLRSIVERLGVALEQELLRPYYGKLRFDLAATENVRVSLTPILLDTALDEEKPPVERNATVIMGSDRDRVEPWVTDPTTYTIDNLLSGWYSMRLERPGYEGLGTENARWEGRDVYGHLQIYDRTTNQPLRLVDARIARFVVRVDPLSTETIDGDKLELHLRKKIGSVEARVKRQYLEDDYTHKPRRVILIGDEELEINQPLGVDEYADDEECDLFEERKSGFSNYGQTYVASGQHFDIETFKGGRLIIEDYQDEAIPVGQYQMALWDPNYQIHQGSVSIRDGDDRKVTRAVLNRDTQNLALMTTGPKPAFKVVLIGEETKQKIDLPLDFQAPKVHSGLPIDKYTATSTIPGFGGWQQTAQLLTANSAPPIYDREKDLELQRQGVEEKKARERQRQKDREEGRKESRKEDEVREMPLKSSSESRVDSGISVVNVKTRLCLAGRLTALSRPLDAAADDFCIDRNLGRILDLLLYGDEFRPEEEKGNGVLQGLANAGKVVIEEVAEQLLVPAVQPAEGTKISSVQGGGPESNGGAVNPALVEKEAPVVSVREALPRDPDELRALLVKHLEYTDLLVLDGRDMARLREAPDVAAIVARWVQSNGTLYAFVADAGDYGEILGTPLITEAETKETDRFSLAPGEVAGISLQVPEKKVKVKSDRVLPRITKLPPGNPWRVVAFSKGRKDPRILERSSRDKGGYIVVWLDDSDSFRGRRGGTVPEVEAARAKVEERVLEWARFLMYRHYDTAGDQRRHAEQALH